MLSIRKAAIVWLKRSAKVAWEVPLSLERVTIIVLSLSVGALIVAMVVFRYFLEIPLMWVEEIVLYIIFWCYILGAAYATYERTHIKGGVVHRHQKKSNGKTQICVRQGKKQLSAPSVYFEVPNEVSISPDGVLS